MYRNISPQSLIIVVKNLLDSFSNTSICFDEESFVTQFEDKFSFNDFHMNQMNLSNINTENFQNQSVRTN